MQIGGAQLVRDAGPIARQQLRRPSGAKFLLYSEQRMADQVRGQERKIDLRQLGAPVRLAERALGRANFSMRSVKSEPTAGLRRSYISKARSR